MKKSGVKCGKSHSIPLVIHYMSMYSIKAPYVQYYSTSRTIIITLIIATMFCKYSMFEGNYSLLLFR